MLPESQLDRFMVSLSMGYPDHASLINILRDRQDINPLEKAETVIQKRRTFESSEPGSESLVSDDRILSYVADLAEATRDHELITLGLSPRGTLALCRMSKAAAFVEGRDYVVPEDIKKVFGDVAGHRMVLESRARYEDKTSREILDEILDTVPVPKVEG